MSIDLFIDFVGFLLRHVCVTCKKEMRSYNCKIHINELLTRCLRSGFYLRGFSSLSVGRFSQRSLSNNYFFPGLGLGPPPALFNHKACNFSSYGRRSQLLYKLIAHGSPRPRSHLKYTNIMYSTKQRNIERPIVVAVEGNIGSGKTRMLDYFEKNVPEVETLMEPVHKWRNYNGHNLLAMMYNDPKRWSFTFQSYVQLTMAESHQIVQTKPVLMRERSIFSAKYCFVENLYESEKMSKAEYDVLTGWFDWIVENQAPKVDKIIYLRTNPENCQRRIIERSRDEETSIPLEYLNHLHQLHEDWLVNQTKFSLPAPVIVLDANQPLEQMFKMYTEDQHKIITVR